MTRRRSPRRTGSAGTSCAARWPRLGDPGRLPPPVSIAHRLIESCATARNCPGSGSPGRSSPWRVCPVRLAGSRPGRGEFPDDLGLVHAGHRHDRDDRGVQPGGVILGHALPAGIRAGRAPTSSSTRSSPMAASAPLQASRGLASAIGAGAGGRGGRASSWNAAYAGTVRYAAIIRRPICRGQVGCPRSGRRRCGRSAHSPGLPPRGTAGTSAGESQFVIALSDAFRRPVETIPGRSAARASAGAGLAVGPAGNRRC